MPRKFDNEGDVRGIIRSLTQTEERAGGSSRAASVSALAEFSGLSSAQSAAVWAQYCWPPARSVEYVSVVPAVWYLVRSIERATGSTTPAKRLKLGVAALALTSTLSRDRGGGTLDERIERLPVIKFNEEWYFSIKILLGPNLELAWVRTQMPFGAGDAELMENTLLDAITGPAAAMRRRCQQLRCMKIKYQRSKGGGGGGAAGGSGSADGEGDDDGAAPSATAGAGKKSASKSKAPAGKSGAGADSSRKKARRAESPPYATSTMSSASLLAPDALSSVSGSGFGSGFGSGSGSDSGDRHQQLFDSYAGGSFPSPEDQNEWLSTSSVGSVSPEHSINFPADDVASSEAQLAGMPVAADPSLNFLSGEADSAFAAFMDDEPGAAGSSGGDRSGYSLVDGMVGGVLGFAYIAIVGAVFLLSNSSASHAAASHRARLNGGGSSNGVDRGLGFTGLTPVGGGGVSSHGLDFSHAHLLPTSDPLSGGVNRSLSHGAIPTEYLCKCDRQCSTTTVHTPLCIDGHCKQVGTKGRQLIRCRQCDSCVSSDWKIYQDGHPDIAQQLKLSPGMFNGIVYHVQRLNPSPCGARTCTRAEVIAAIEAIDPDAGSSSVKKIAAMIHQTRAAEAASAKAAAAAKAAPVPTDWSRVSLVAATSLLFVCACVELARKLCNLLVAKNADLASNLFAQATKLADSRAQPNMRIQRHALLQLCFEAGWLLLQIAGALPTTEVAACLVGGVGSMVAMHACQASNKLPLLYGGASTVALWIGTVLGMDTLNGELSGVYVLQRSTRFGSGPQEECHRLCLVLMLVLHIAGMAVRFWAVLISSRAYVARRVGRSLSEMTLTHEIQQPGEV